MKKLRIAQVAPLWFSLPPIKYGGTERIAYYLTEELVRRGHDVTLFASGDSKTSAKLVPGWPRALVHETYDGKPLSWNQPVFTLLNISMAFERAEDFDIIHLHENAAALSTFFTKLSPKPSVTTFHDPFPDEKHKDRIALLQKYKNHPFAALSDSHRKLGEKAGVKNIHTIYNGVDTKSLPYGEGKGEYVAWLGRFAPNKGASEAILAAQAAGKKLLLAGRLDINSSMAMEYFRKDIEPHLGESVSYIGEIDDNQKTDFLGQAEALLVPILWEEPFGLVITEAQSCGTPVVAFRRGSTPELVKEGETGFVVDDVEAMTDALRKISAISRKACREHVEKNFTIEKMAERYENLYKEILSEQ